MIGATRWISIAVATSLLSPTGATAQAVPRERDPGAARLVMGPTARTLERGQGYASVQLPVIPFGLVFLPFIAGGVTDYFTLGGGASVIGGQGVFYLAPKLRAVHTRTVDAALGVLYLNMFSAIGEGDVEGFGVVYGNTTYGSDALALTAGLGWGFQGTDVASHPIVQLGGQGRLARGVHVVNENWIVTGTDLVLVSLGLRVFSREAALDLAAIHPAFSGSETELWLSFTVAYYFRLGR